jgi:DNA-binding MarR family transcriptional regulator
MNVENQAAVMHVAVKRCIDGIVAFREFQRHRARLTLTDKELMILQVLRGLDGDKGASITDIASAADIPTSTVSAAVVRLYQNEYVDKGFERDRPRAVIVRLTPKGTEYLEAEEVEAVKRREIFVAVTEVLAHELNDERVWQIVTSWLNSLGAAMETNLADAKARSRAKARKCSDVKQ